MGLAQQQHERSHRRIVVVVGEVSNEADKADECQSDVRSVQIQSEKCPGRTKSHKHSGPAAPGCFAKPLQNEKHAEQPEQQRQSGQLSVDEQRIPPHRDRNDAN